MKFSRTLDEMIRKYDADIIRILVTRFKNVIKYYSLDDIKAAIYLRLHEKNYVESFRPFEIYVTEDSWAVLPTPAKFSTYICTFIFNYIYAYFNKIDPNYKCLSLDDYCGYIKSKDSKTRPYNNIDKYYKSAYTNDFESNLYLGSLEEHVKDKLPKGNFVETRKLHAKVLKVIDSQVNGCAKDKILSKFPKVEKVLTELEKDKFIKSNVNVDGKILYSIGDVKRRSLLELLRYYSKGYTDTDIANEMKVTVAGVGAMKKLLRKKLDKFLIEQNGTHA